ncbi:TonB-dependent receptor plug domain-containing protein [Thermodesulforhabdus norvegica]|uniref:Vitamin B12 transporter n=1 Tax=Thermodesulforhabdus norvegica TaxID=39841 RepID=A0A1I4QX95_9BACT|nr:TonB-dependent receptor [Thermodesulforhabdus norvegica]SFM44627.1 vitamin B12 transporter [Thermodesulforhabdus norvegica]
MRVLPVFVAFLSLGFNLFCCHASRAFEMEPLVITATRVPTPSHEVPVRVDVITREEIERSHASDLSELLIQKLPTHFHRYPGSLTSVDIRGFRTDTHGTDIKGRVLVLIDGHRAGTGNISAVPLENVEKIEILRGPASVMYGSAALGGVINIITREGRGKPTVEAGFEYGSWNRKKGSLSASGGLSGDQIGISFGARQIHQDDDYNDGDGDRVENTHYSDEAYSLSLTARPAEGHRIMFVGQYFRAWDVGTPGATYSPDYDDYKSILRRYGALSYDGGADELGLSWHISGYSVYDRSSWNDPAQAWGYLNHIVETETQGLRGHVAVPAFGLGRIIVGGDFDHIEVDSWNVPPGVAPWSPDTSYDNYALYGEQKISLFDRLNIYAGLRYDLFDESLEETPGLEVTAEDKSFDDVSWRVGASFDLTDWLTARGHIGTGFRAPTADELAGRFAQGSWTKIAGNPDLEPEKSTTYELGVDAVYGKASLGFSVFYTDYTDRIVGGFTTCIDGDCTWTTYRNVDGATFTGMDGYASCDFAFSLGSFNATVTPYVNWIYYFSRELEDESSAQDLGTDTVTYVSKANLIAGLRFHFDRYADLNIWANYHGPQKVQNWDYTSPLYGTVYDKGGFTIYSLRLDFHIFDHLHPYLTIDNLTDKDYAYADGYPMPGLTVIGGFKLRF